MNLVPVSTSWLEIDVLGFTISFVVLRGFVSCHNFSISENIILLFCPFGREILGRLNSFFREILGK